MGIFPKIRGTSLGAPIIRTIVYWGLYWGPPSFGKLPMDSGKPRNPCVYYSYIGGHDCLTCGGQVSGATLLNPKH